MDIGILRSSNKRQRRRSARRVICAYLRRGFHGQLNACKRERAAYLTKVRADASAFRAKPSGLTGKTDAAGADGFVGSARDSRAPAALSQLADMNLAVISGTDARRLVGNGRAI